MEVAVRTRVMSRSFEKLDARDWCFLGVRFVSAWSRPTTRRWNRKYLLATRSGHLQDIAVLIHIFHRHSSRLGSRSRYGMWTIASRGL